MGEESNNGDKNAAYLNYKVLCRNNSDEWFMDYAEVEFILAEAALKGLISGGEAVAKAHYEKPSRHRSRNGLTSHHQLILH